MTPSRLSIAVLAAALCSACAADTGRLETASVTSKKPARPVAVKAATATPVATKPSADADKAGYCGRWWKHRANNTLPEHVRAGSSDIAHNDSYCDTFR